MTFFCFLIAITITAVATAKADSGFAVDPIAPIDAHAELMQFNEPNGQVRLSGTAHMIQGPMQIDADEITVFFAPSPDRHAVKLTALGNVRLVSNNGRTAKAERADYDIAKNKLVLDGNVSANQIDAQGRQQVLTGQRLTINMTNGQTQLTGDAKAGRPKLKLSR